MSRNAGSRREADVIDVRRAAALVGCHPETIRRWVWSGRIPARREGRRLLIARADVEAVARRHAGVAGGLAEWAERARASREASAARRSGRSAAALVIEDRRARSRGAGAGR